MMKRPNVVLAVVAAAVIAIAIVAGVISANRATPTLDPNTPAGTVQLFVQAIMDEDDVAAVALLDPDLQCTAPLIEIYRPDGVVVDVISAEESAKTASVVLELTERDGPWNSWSHREHFDLIRADAGWLITGSPWPVYSCE